MNQWKSAHAAATEARTLADAMKGADVFFGLSVRGAVSRDMVKSMAGKPIVFAMANPDPEITPEEVLEVREDALRSEEHTSELQSLMRISYAVFCVKYTNPCTTLDCKRMQT